MKLIDYFKDKAMHIFIFLTAYSLILIFLLCFKIRLLLILYISIILFASFFIGIIYEYFKKIIYYRNVEKTLEKLDKKYLITEIIKEPNFIEGKMLVDFLYDIDKSMIEEINKYKHSSEEFKEYLELWVHEIKTPIATSKLIVNNNKSEITDSIEEELAKIDNYAEQVLYYARSGVVEKDYSVTNVDLKEVINTVIKRNKKDILFKQFKIDIMFDSEIVKTDSKWIEFILNQILINSIKYTEPNGNIKFYIDKQKNNTSLIIQDTGIGIKKEELKRVFEKGFTGSNGRKILSSTGIGLHLCKKLCDKLGINIIVSSEENKGTAVKIIFPISSLIYIKD